MLQIAELQNKQKICDRKIITKFNEIEKEERIIKESTALIVELSEFANEKEEFFKFFKPKKRNSKKEQLKEAADCLAYYLSLANEIGFELTDPCMDFIKSGIEEPNKHFKIAVMNISYIDSGQADGYRITSIRKSFVSYLRLLASLDINFEEVKATYLYEVSESNLERQDIHY